MANIHPTLTSLFEDIADAIRNSSPITEKIKADVFPAYIRMLHYTGDIPETPSILNSCSWDFIRWASDEGIADLIWNIGDRKKITFSGAIGGFVNFNLSPCVYIIGFNHNEDIEGKNRIHFGTFFTDLTGGTDITLVDTYYNNNIYTDGSKLFNFNHWGNYNYGGWKGCDLRYDILGSTKTAPSGYGSSVNKNRQGYDANDSTATSPKSGTFMAALPSDLRAVMKSIKKFSDNYGSKGSPTEESISESVDYLPLLSEYEVYGSRNYANTYEKNYQKQYDYYRNGNSKVKYRYDAEETSAVYTLRSVSASYSNRICASSRDGLRGGYINASSSRGLSPIICV